MPAEIMAAPIMKTCRACGCILALLLAVACAVTPDVQPAAPAGPAPLIARQYGRVAMVNQAGRYVVLECAVLPKENEEITLYKGREQTGRVKINRTISGHFAAADILDGNPATGDTFALPPAGSTP